MFKLFYTFFKIGICTFGGGYAMLPILEREIVEKNNWATNDEILNYYAIGQCTPGIIAVNVSTFIGYKLSGVLGAIFSTLGLITPSLIIITIIASILDNIAQTSIVIHIFNGIQLVVIALVLNAIIKIWKGSIKDITSFIIFLIIITLSLVFNLSPAIGVITSGILGICIKSIGEKKK
ncbi:MAG: chromate transporter [Clostridium perfringens]|nr:chromate transporter [Clostridium perfringens]